MKVHTKVVLEWKDGKYQRIESECESFEYEGPVSECKGGGGSTETVQKSDPWAGAQLYMTGGNNDLGSNSASSALFPEAARLYRGHNPTYYQGETVAGPSADTMQSQQMTRDIATQGSQGNTGLQNLYGDTMGGSYLYGGQGFDRAFQAASNRILPQIDSRFALSGRTGSGLAQTAQTQALGDAFAGLYNEERGRQNQMAALAPQIDQMRYADANTLANLGMQQEDYQQDIINSAIERHNYEQNLPYAKLDRFAQIINPSIGAGGTTTTQTPLGKRNRTAGAAGGAISGASMGSYFGPWGALIGGIGGGLLGGL